MTQGLPCTNAKSARISSHILLVAHPGLQSYPGQVITLARLLVDLLRHPRPKALELMKLRRRLEGAAREQRACGEDERQLAVELRRMRSEIAEATGKPTCCGACARKHPPPHGRWQGGYCCGTDTWRVFTDDELWSLAAGGTRPGDLRPAVAEAAGCLFRGPRGCVLRPQDRPNICLRYLCLDLVAELRARGDFKPLNTLCESLARSFRQLAQLRAARLQLQEFEQMCREMGVKSED